MTNQEILTKAIQKAIDGGWGAFGFKDFAVREHNIEFITHPKPGLEMTAVRGYLAQPNTVIFNHDFAKAVFGDDPQHSVMHSVEPNQSGLVGARGLENWQYHLQQMVTAPDPIKYLADNI